VSYRDDAPYPKPFFHVYSYHGVGFYRGVGYDCRIQSLNLTPKRTLFHQKTHMNDQNEFKKYAVHHLGMSSAGLEQYQRFMNENAGIWNFTPNVIEERQMRATVIDVFSRLMADRIVFLGTPVDDYIANVITAQLLFLESADPKK